MKTTFLITSLLLAMSCSSQDVAAYRKVRDYYLEKTAFYTGGVTGLTYDKNTYKISIDKDFVIPILSVTFRYEQTINPTTKKTEERVAFDCKESDCIFAKEKLEKESTCSVEFRRKEECEKFIRLLSEFRFEVELKKSDTN